MSLVEEFAEHRWDFFHDFLESVISQVKRDENDLCAVIEKV